MFSYDYEDGILRIKLGDETVAVQTLDPRTQEYITDENYKEIAEFMLNIYEKDQAFKPDMADTDSLELKRDQLLAEYKEIWLTENVNAEIYGNPAAIFPPMAFSASTEFDDPEKDRLAQMIREIDKQLGEGMT